MLISASVWSRTFSSASWESLARASRPRRLMFTATITTSTKRASAANPSSPSRTSTGSSVTLPTWVGSRAMGRTYSPIRSFRPKQEHIDRPSRQSYLTGSYGHPPHHHHPRPPPAQEGGILRAGRRRAAEARGKHAGHHV